MLRVFDAMLFQFINQGLVVQQEQLRAVKLWLFSHDIVCVDERSRYRSIFTASLKALYRLARRKETTTRTIPNAHITA